MLVSLGRISSVISDWVLATVRALGLAGLEIWVELMVRILQWPFVWPDCRIRPSALACRARLIARYNGTGGGRSG